MELRDIVRALAKYTADVSGPALAQERGWDWPTCQRIIAANKSLIHMTKTEPPMIMLTPTGGVAAAAGK